MSNAHNTNHFTGKKRFQTKRHKKKPKQRRQHKNKYPKE